MTVGRRRFLTGAGAAASLACKPAFAQVLAAPGAIRVASLDWGVSETLYAMNVPVAGAADSTGYDKIAALATPPSTLNLGLWNAPNIELLQALKPDLILIQAWQQGLLPLLRRIASTEEITIYTRQGSVYENACMAARAIARWLGRSGAGEMLIERGEMFLERCRAALRAHRGEAVIVVMIVDGRYFVAFSRASLFHDIIGRLDLVNDWDGPAQLLCGASVIDLTALASSRANRIIVIDPPGQSADHAFYRSQLWTSLPFVTAGRVAHIPSLWEFGALPTGYRFAELMTAALTGAGAS